MKIIKKRIKSILFSFGYKVVPSKKDHRGVSPLQICMRQMLGIKQKINIVQVGANDGKLNDPIYQFVRENPERTKVILVEPQKVLIPILEKNYGFHTSKYIFNGAIGPNGSITLFYILEEYWKYLRPPYAKKWPEYRAPTGVTSSSFDHVYKWVKRNYNGNDNITTLIGKMTVESIGVDELLTRSSLFDEVDVLQIDAEGFDDEVIYASNIEKIKPYIINFESKSIQTQKLKKLNNYLQTNGYSIVFQARDSLAILTKARKREQQRIDFN